MFLAFLSPYDLLDISLELGGLQYPPSLKKG